MASTKMFVHYPGTVDAFKALPNIADYFNKIVFIKGGTDGKGAAIYTHGSYFANFAEFIDTYVKALNYVKGVNVKGTNYNAAAGGGYVAFGASDPTTVDVNAGQNGITIGLTDAFINKVSSTATALGSSSDEADAAGSAFARIAALAEAIGTNGSVAGQITAAINALRTEIVGTLGTDDAKTLAAINDELDAIDAKWASYVSKAELATIGDNKADGDKVNVKVTTLGGKVTAVEVNEAGLTGALNLKANAADVYTKGDAENMAQGKVDTLANGTVKANTEAIARLNGGTDIEGSVDRKIHDAINAFAGSADNDNVIENVTELLAYVSKVDGGKDLSVAIADIEANKAAINTLKGDAKTAGSVAKAIADEVVRAEAAYAVKGTEGVAAGAAARAEAAYGLAGQKATAAEAKAQAVAAIGEIAEVEKKDESKTVKVYVKTKAGSVSSVVVDDAGIKTYADGVGNAAKQHAETKISEAVGAYTASGVTASGLRKEIEERDAASQAYADSLFAWEEINA